MTGPQGDREPGSRTSADRLCIGVTGHRGIASPEDVGDQVDGVIDDLLTGQTWSEIEVCSALAEGADRLVVERVLVRPGSRLHVILPLEPEAYRADFGTPGSVDVFNRLLGDATGVEVAGPDSSGTRQSAYERAGRAMLARCTALVALWDGQPARGRGGTAQMVEEARRAGLPTIVIPVERT